MISNDLATPLILRHGGLRARRHGRGAPVDPPHLDLRDPAARLCLLPHRRRGGARLDRLPRLRGDRAVRAGLLRRAVLEGRDLARAPSPAWSPASPPGPIACCCRAWRTAASCRRRSSRTARSGSARLKPTALFGLDLPRLTHGVVWSLGRQHPRSSSPSRCCRAPRPIERVQANAFVTPDYVAPGKGFALWPTVVTVGELTATVSRYLGETRTTRSLEAFAASRGHGIEPDGEADIHMLRFAEHLLASRDRRGIVAARPVADAAAAKPLDASRDAAPRRCVRRHPVQPRPAADGARQRAPGRQRVRQGASAPGLEPRLPRSLGAAGGNDARRRRSRRDHPPYRRSRNLRARHGRGPYRRAAAGGMLPTSSPSRRAFIRPGSCSRSGRTRCRTAAS